MTMADSNTDARPTHGWTRHGHAVHGKSVDHLPEASAYQRLNKKVAIWLTNNVGTMTCFWFFCLLSLVVLPSVLFAMGIIGKDALGITFVTGFGFELMMTWMLSTFIQLVLLPAIMAGQNIQTSAADARAAKQFEDTETIADRLDEHTAGGIKTVLDRIDALEVTLTKE